jgi:plastocyanin
VYLVVDTLRYGRVCENGCLTIAMAPRDRFEPAELTIPVGTTVQWRNVDRWRHNVSSAPLWPEEPFRLALPPGASRLRTGSVRPGQTYAYTFEVAGTYGYYCDLHLGMEGRVVVQ